MPITNRVFSCSIFLFSILAAGRFEECRERAWEKIGGVRPEYIDSKTALFTSINSDGIVSRCFDKCERANCTAFVIDLQKSVCYSVQIKEDELLPDSNSIFYQQICAKVPASCRRTRFWQLERTPGAILIDSNSISLSGSVNRSRCYESCLEAGNRCKSTEFRAIKPLSANQTLGRCSLSMLERGTRPQAYRASIYRDEYLQNQCENSTKRDYCSYAEYHNVTLPYSDLALTNLDEKECEKRCDTNADGFLCRSYTVVHSSSSTKKPICLLHSEDTRSLGVSSMVNAMNVTYREREPCLDLRVQCTDMSLVIEFRTTEPFLGRIYATGHAETCGAQGLGRNFTVLTLPLPRANEIVNRTETPCGFTPAFSIDNQNRTRTMLWTTIIVQFNPIIQRLGDQAIRVGCSLDDHSPPEPRNITVHSSFAFLDPNAGLPPIGSTVVNVSSEIPLVTMRILDEKMKDAIVTQLGQKLLLKIEIKPVDGPYDITAGHLVASSASGDSSYLLLDETGCPTDPATFPALSKDRTDNRSLVATFAAFKFPDSQLVRFNVMVRFCIGECIPAQCGGMQVSYGRKKRSVTINRVLREIDLARNDTLDQLPLQLSIIVQSPRIVSADRLLSRDVDSNPDTIFISGRNSVDGLLCVDASLALSLLIFWLIIQIVLIAGCLLTVTQYRRTAIQAEEERAEILARHLYGMHGGNLEIARRVRWADRNSPSPIE